MKKSLFFMVIAFFSTALAIATPSDDQTTNLTDNSVVNQQGNFAKDKTDSPFLTLRGVLWDNGDTDGSNGYSNADVGAFGFRRTLLDDFVIPAGELWTITDLHTLHLWNTLPVGSGTDFTLTFRTDACGAPGAPFHTANTQSYAEYATGRNWFGRDEYLMDYNFDPVVLGPGTYWIEGNVIGPENNFWMINQSVTGSEFWLDYADYSGLQSGSSLFGTPADLAFALTGTKIGGCDLEILDSYSGYGVWTVVMNCGTSDANNVRWEYVFIGGSWIAQPAGRVVGGFVDIPAGESVIIYSGWVYGIAGYYVPFFVSFGAFHPDDNATWFRRALLWYQMLLLLPLL